MTIELFTVEWEYIKNNLEFSSMEDDVTEASIAYRIIDPKLVEDVNKYEQEIFYMAVRDLGIQAKDVLNYEWKLPGYDYLIINMEVTPFTTNRMNKIGQQIIYNASVKLMYSLGNDLSKVQNIVRDDRNAEMRGAYGVGDLVMGEYSTFEIMKRTDQLLIVDFNIGDYIVPVIADSLYAENLPINDSILKELEMFWINATGKTFTQYLIEHVRVMDVYDDSQWENHVTAQLRM